MTGALPPPVGRSLKLDGCNWGRGTCRDRALHVCTSQFDNDLGCLLYDDGDLEH
jgi:hypothetical protein